MVPFSVLMTGPASLLTSMRLRGGGEFEANIQAKTLAGVELQGRNFVVGKAIRMNHQFVVSGFQIDEFKSSVAVRAGYCALY